VQAFANPCWLYSLTVYAGQCLLLSQANKLNVPFVLPLEFPVLGLLPITEKMTVRTSTVSEPRFKCAEGLTIPQLKDLNRSELGVLEYVSLGSDHQYFARFERGTRYLLDPDIISKEGISEKKSLIQHFALGASSTYVITRKDGYRNYNLKGHYRSLGQRLDALKEGVGVKVRNLSY
jgi:hypothetical protein